MAKPGLVSASLHLHPNHSWALVQSLSKGNFQATVKVELSGRTESLPANPERGWCHRPRDNPRANPDQEGTEQTPLCEPSPSFLPGQSRHFCTLHSHAAGPQTSGTARAVPSAAGPQNTPGLTGLLPSRHALLRGQHCLYLE